MPKYRYGWIEISHNLFELDFLLLSVYAVLFYPAVFEMCRYVVRTSQRLQDRIKQHIPKAIRNQAQTNCDLSQSNHTCTSAIGQHLLNNKKCAAHYDDNQFSILAKGRTLFHLSTLEATFIKMLKPELCRQKEFVYTLKLRH